MSDLYYLLGWAQFAMWSGLALAAANVWRKRRDTSASWLALTFASLALVVVAARFVSDGGGTHAPEPIVKALVVLLVAFPYLLHRFVRSFVEAKRWVIATVHFLTGALLVWTVLAPRFPRPGEARPVWVQAYTLLFAAQWGFILVRVTIRLWSAARAQPAVARRRLITMGIGAAGLAATLVVSAFLPPSTEPTIPRLVTQIITLCTCPFFLLGFAPPRWVRVLWTRREEAAVRDMEIGLAGSLSRAEIGQSFVPALAELLGGNGAALVDHSGAIVGSHQMRPLELSTFLGSLPPDTELYQPVQFGTTRATKMANGWLLVTMSPFTPFFGVDELRMLSASAVVADLALGRASLFELERQSRNAMQDFVAIASHDLRTPVTVIKGFTDLMTNGWETLSTDQRGDYFGAIQRQIVHLDRLISDLLTTSKLDVGEIGAVPEVIHIEEVVREAVRSVVGNDGAVTVSAAGAADVVADPEHVARIVHNYVKNALVHGAPPVTVELARENASLVIRVRDHGRGIPSAFVPKLFEKFSRVDNKRSRAAKGTGLGLSIVRGLAHANGGEAWYEPNTPTGSCFAISLPLAGTPSEPERVDA